MLTELQVLEKIGDHNFKIKESIIRAVQHFQTKLADESLILSALTKSSYIRYFILLYIKESFKNEAEVEIKNKRGMILLTIKTEPIILLKFKKFNKNNRVAVSKTLQAQAFSNQTQGELFPEYSSTLHLHAGYKWDETYTQVSCLIGLPKSLTGHSWVALIPGSGDINNILETTSDQIQKPQVRVKIKEREHEKTA